MGNTPELTSHDRACHNRARRREARRRERGFMGRMKEEL